MHGPKSLREGWEGIYSQSLFNHLILSCDFLKKIMTWRETRTCCDAVLLAAMWRRITGDAYKSKLQDIYTIKPISTICQMRTTENGKRPPKNAPIASCSFRGKLSRCVFPILWEIHTCRIYCVICLQSCEIQSVNFTAGWFSLHTTSINDGEQKPEIERERGGASEKEREGCCHTDTAFKSSLWVGIHRTSFVMTNHNNTKLIYRVILDGSFTLWCAGNRGSKTARHKCKLFLLPITWQDSIQRVRSKSPSSEAVGLNLVLRSRGLNH